MTVGKGLAICGMRLSVSVACFSSVPSMAVAIGFLLIFPTIIISIS